MFALKNISVLLAKHDSGELRCPVTALISVLNLYLKFSFCCFTSSFLWCIVSMFCERVQNVSLKCYSINDFLSFLL